MLRFSILAMFLTATLFSVLSPAADEKAVSLFNGKNLKGWLLKGGPQAKRRSLWVVGKVRVDPGNLRKLRVVPSRKPSENALVNAATGVDLFSEKMFGDCTIELEFMVPRGSNSGIYVMGEYEIQILDSYGKKKVGPGDLGGIYSAAAPRTNVAKKPGEWQKFVIEFQAPKFKDGKKVSNAKFLKVTLNGSVIHENVEVKKATPGGLTGKEKARGPLMFQGNHGPVAFRDIKVTPK